MTAGKWSLVGSASYWSALDDIVTEQQTPSSVDYITFTSNNVGGSADADVGLTTAQLQGATITKANAWFYTPNANALKARVRDGSGTILADQLYSSTGWHSLSVTLNGSQAQIDGLRISFRKEGSGEAARSVYAAFVKLDLELPASQRLLHVGINANSRSGKPPGNVQDGVAETGSTHLREDLEWSEVEPNEGEWKWESTDTMFREAAERGMTILPILNSPPCWAVPPGTESKKCYQTYPVEDADFANFTARAVERYGIEGDFWQENPELEEGLAPKYFEIWNEPYLTQFTNENVDPDRYGDLFKAAVVAGEGANPKAKYLIEATVDAQITKTGEWVNWTEALVKNESALGTYVDGVAVHPYPGNRDPFYPPSGGKDASLRNAYRVYQDWLGQGINRPIWITEVGYSSCDDGADECVPGETQAAREEVKAEWLADLFDVVDRGDYGFVHAVYLYNLKQTESAEKPTAEKSNWYGILDQEGVLPAWASFASAVAAYDGAPVPNTTIVGKSFPGGDATFTFTVTDPTSTLECRLDSGEWTVCTSPKTYAKVGSGHTFRVRGTNAEATETTPAEHTW